MGTLPNYITLFRIALIPLLVGMFYYDRPIGYLVSAALFMIACLTDYLDGYVARAYKQVTSLGSFLDPLADKLLVASVLVMLAGFEHIKGISLIPAVLIICREILVSGLREFLGKLHQELPVTSIAKWKTGFQMISLGCLIVADPTGPFAFMAQIGVPALWISAILTVLTGYGYLKRSLVYVRKDMKKSPKN